MSERVKLTSIEDEPLFKEFCSNREIKHESIRAYKYALLKYCNFVNKGLEELIEEAEEEEELSIRMRKRKINQYLTNFKSRLDESDLSERSKKQIIMLVKAFYKEFDIEIPQSKRRKSSPARAETIADLPTIEEIQLFLEYCSSVYKAIVLTSLSSGMSRAEISSLTFKHFYDALSLTPYPETLRELIDKAKTNTNDILFWNITRVKTGNIYFTFSSPESLDRIIMYLEELYQRHPDYKPKLEDNLFRSTPPNKPLNANNIGSMFVFINKRNGFRRVNGRFVVRSHNLRKYFATTLEKNKIPHLTSRWLLGHTVDKVTNAYFKPDAEAVKNDYLKVVNQLTTNKVEIKLINQYENLQQQIEEIRHNEQKHLEVIGELMEIANIEMTNLGNADLTDEEAKSIVNEERWKLSRRIAHVQSKLNGKIQFKDKVQYESKVL